MYSRSTTTDSCEERTEINTNLTEEKDISYDLVGARVAGASVLGSEVLG